MKAQFPESPCPVCGVNVPPRDLVWNLNDTLYFYECPSHGSYRRSEAGMLRFRRTASRVARENRTRPTSLELEIAQVLESLEIPYEHNVRVGPFVRSNGRSVYYWLDLCVRDAKIDIECSPTFWHSLYGAKEKDERRRRDLESIGYIVVTLDDSKLRDKVRLRRSLVQMLLQACAETRLARNPA